MSEIRQFAKRQTRYENVIAVDSGDRDWIPNSLLGVISWFQEKADEIPAEYRENARVLIDVDEDDKGTCWARIDVGYTRPETDDEMDARVVQERERLFATEQRELTMLAQLQEKYKHRV